MFVSFFCPSIGYRELNYNIERKYHIMIAEFFSGAMWWWIGWHFMTDWRHLIGNNSNIFFSYYFVPHY